MAKNTEQNNWRFCNKCYSLWWNGMSDKDTARQAGRTRGPVVGTFIYLPIRTRGSEDPPPAPTHGRAEAVFRHQLLTEAFTDGYVDRTLSL